MEEISDIDRSIEILQEMGLKEYEARCFVALTRLSEGTAKRISEVSDVPRTRVYDAVRVLETMGLVEVQHKSPKIFRAIPVEEAVENLRDRFESRTESLGEALRNVSTVPAEDEREINHEVWSLSDSRSISERTRQLVEGAEEEVALVVSTDALDEALVDRLRSASGRGVDVIVGTIGDSDGDLGERLPEAETFASDLGWLTSPFEHPEDDTEIGRIMLVDRETILVSTLHADDEDPKETAVFGSGFDNGLVAIVRRLVSVGR